MFTFPITPLFATAICVFPIIAGQRSLISPVSAFKTLFFTAPSSEGDSKWFHSERGGVVVNPVWFVDMLQAVAC